MARSIACIQRCAVLTLMSSAFGSTALAADFTWSDGLQAEPANHISLVRGFDGQIAATDWSLRELIDKNVGPGKRWAAIDVVMQQCYGGGFVNDIISDGKAQATITTSSSWSQVSWTIQEQKGYDLAVQNFTRAWTDAVKANPKAGMRELAYKARADNWTGELSPPFIVPQPEYPQYGSRDAAPGGANDLRSPRQGDSERVFTAAAIFASPSTLAPRHMVNAGRVVRTMESVSASDQVALLFDTKGSVITPSKDPVRPDAASLGSIPVAGSNSVKGLTSALDGTLFNTEKKAGDRLVLYFTGHGAQATFAPNGAKVSSSSPGGVLDRQTVKPKLVIDPNAVGNAGQTENAPLAQREVGGFASDSFNPNMFGDRDELNGNIDDIQLSFSRALDADTRFYVNGIDVTSQARLVDDRSRIRDLPQKDASTPTRTPTQVWEMQLPYALTSSQLEMTFELAGLDPLIAADENLIGGISLLKGDRELIFVNTPVPEPGTALLLVVGAVGLAVRRRQAKVSHPH